MIQKFLLKLLSYVMSAEYTIMNTSDMTIINQTAMKFFFFIDICLFFLVTLKTFDSHSKVPLSACGLIYRHYGRDILKELYPTLRDNEQFLVCELKFPILTFHSPGADVQIYLFSPD